VKILVTGNMGYIGPVAVEHLHKTMPDSFLAGLDTGYFGAFISTNDILPECRMDVQHFADVRSVPDHVFDGVDVVVHLAGISNDPIGNRFEEITLQINHAASIRLAHQAKRHGCRSFVFASSCSMYGAAPGGICTENSPLNPLTAYARSKAYTERDLEDLADEDFVVTALRFSTACGMSPRLRLDLVLNDFVASAVAERKITILSDGTPWRPLINVKDMARAIEWAIKRRADGGRFLAVNVGRNDANFQVKELAHAVAEVIPSIDVSINEAAQPDKRSYRVNFDLFERIAPDHQPLCTLSETIEELQEGLERMQFRDRDFRNSTFCRLPVISRLRERGLLDQNLYWTASRHPVVTQKEMKL
jgi:nucleoside-diphosphate-sugar epimerase